MIYTVFCGKSLKVNYNAHQKEFTRYDDAMEYALDQIHYSKMFTLYKYIVVYEGPKQDKFPIRREDTKILFQWSIFGHFMMDEAYYLKAKGKLGTVKPDDLNFGESVYKSTWDLQRERNDSESKEIIQRPFL